MESRHAAIKQIVATIADFMNMPCDVEVREETRDGAANLAVSVSVTEDAKFLIGKNGQNLKALEHLVRLATLKGVQDTTLTLDVNDYKKLKAASALELARQAVDRVRMNGRAEVLSPMTPYERRVVHMELASCSDITTESIGQEPQRRVVIKPLV